MDIFRLILNILFPQTAKAAELEAMSAATFREAVPALSFQPQKWILALFPYENPLVKTAVWEVKYRGNKTIARLAGTLIADELTEWLPGHPGNKTSARLAGTLIADELTEWLAELAKTETFREPLLIPIPLAPKRARERGFNQCELLAREIIRIIPEMIELTTDILIKTKETESQTKSKNRAERIKNLEGCFDVKNPEQIKNRNIVLLDDVTTTGATLTEAGRRPPPPP